MKCAATITIEDFIGCLFDITLTPRNWSKVKAGKPLKIRGKGYSSEIDGKCPRSYWNFGGGINGSLYVSYGNDGAFCFDGVLKDAEIIEHCLDDHPRIALLIKQVNSLPVNDEYKSQLLDAIKNY